MVGSLFYVSASACRKTTHKIFLFTEKRLDNLKKLVYNKSVMSVRV